MVSQVPTVSGKRMRLQAAHNMAAPAAALALLVTALLVAFTWETLAVGTVIYLLTIPAGVAQFRRLQSRDTSAQTVSVAYGRSRRDHAR
jgi:CDP-diacylglycerol--serine O-phosphatidyltransferase